MLFGINPKRRKDIVEKSAPLVQAPWPFNALPQKTSPTSYRFPA